MRSSTWGQSFGYFAYCEQHTLPVELLIFPVLVGAVSLVLVAMLINNIKASTKWPMYGLGILNSKSRESMSGGLSLIIKVFTTCIVNTFERTYDFFEIRSSMANLSKEALR